MSYAIGIDIGGTKTAIGLIGTDGEVRTKVSLPTDQTVGPEVMVDRMAAAIQDILTAQGIAESELLGIGVGAPGPLNTKEGKIAEPPNLRGWWNFPIVDSLKRYFSLPIRLENDATAAALAEKWLGAAKDAEHFVFITISTGIGAGIYSHGKLITGASGNAGDVGHIVVDPSVGTCVCGQKGCWEFVASGTAVARQASELLGREVSSKEAFDLAAAGQPVIQELVAKVFENIGVGCVTLINTFDPEKLVIGGGVSQVGDPLFNAVRDYVSKYALNPSGRQTPIVPAALHQDAGLIGAAALIHIPY
ncbi:ROK family protein [Paenibacillus phoenicis]|uniref:ROK family protein n=1 Tax=Paenibacillus phoenicis TaxID=554117 RepID=A0ABU5PJY8_9BACL|nr:MULTISPECIES: ROK family protein [Paenibacillus]EES72547.1 putative glucokinase [Paenibacillus sp. oral taxon 786 str. D14]MCT2197542.1 ROK family protein [Paenibacillus sp. p3-SID1389]MEA3570186.1 ROK family protein [Paenibacillus phoenicis]